MKLTICLVTKGREQYLDQILSSFEPLLNDDAIEFLIIDNGTPVGIRERLNHWGYLNPNCVKIIRLETNDSRPSTFWNKVVEEGADWTVFPSDDDEFRPEIIAAWRSAIHRNSELVGFAASAEVMNANGSLTGEKLEPSARRFQSTLDQLASALHEPPFLWPSLFIRVSKLPIVVPNSRYAFDWWIGINLLIAGEVETTDMVGINYRVHVEQESFLAPLRRKYFEAEFWVDDFLRGRGLPN
jgi:glycosyltransferase involved in cell wall biosynthesis